MNRRGVLATVLGVALFVALAVVGRMEWVASGTHVLFTVALGGGAGIVAFTVLKISAAPKVPADKAAARDELEYGVRRVINCNMALMEACRDLASSCQRMPPEYRPIAEHTLRFAKLMEEATYDEGASDGVFPRPLFNAGTTTPVPPQLSVDPPRTMTLDDVDLALDDGGELRIGGDTMHRRSGDWVAGQLITR